MKISGSVTLRPAAAVSRSKVPYNAAEASNASATLLLADQGFLAAPPSASGGRFNPVAAAQSTEARLLGYLGYSPTRSPTAPSPTRNGSLFNRAAASQSTATELFAYEGLPSTKPPAPIFGPRAASASTQAARYGRGQYEAVSALLDSGFSRSHIGAGTGSLSLFA